MVPGWNLQGCGPSIHTALVHPRIPQARGVHKAGPFVFRSDVKTPQTGLHSSKKFCLHFLQTYS